MYEALFEGLSQSLETNCFSRILHAVVDYLAEQEVVVDRMQIPMSRYSGLRHPLYGLIILTYKDDQVRTENIPHMVFSKREERDFMDVQNSPYGLVFDRPNQHARINLLDTETPFSILDTMRQDGFTEYLVVNMTLPNRKTQFFSMATRVKDGFPEQIDDLIKNLYIPFSLALYGMYQSHVSISLAETYLGARTGENVLNGNIYRGAQETIDAGIMFCDVRGFTSMSEQLGAKGVVKIMNDVFQIIEEEVGGEILKFIGDALLLIFPREEYTNNQSLSRAMIDGALRAVRRVEEYGRQLELPLCVGFGCHIGHVLYGNIGTNDRLDFTVMGPAVNLTSRLESMCKEIGTQLTVSWVVAKENTELLESFGEHKIKGVVNPVDIWGVRTDVQSCM